MPQLEGIAGAVCMSDVAHERPLGLHFAQPGEAQPVAFPDAVVGRGIGERECE